MEPFRYLLVLVACLAITAPLEWVIGARVYRRPRRLVLTLLVAMTPFVVWDLVGIARGHWDFSPRYTLGIDLGGVMPLEELLFFVVIPICALLTHQAVLRLGARLWPRGRLAREARTFAAVAPSAIPEGQGAPRA
jgi:lycopene cyclase domain-containing protein